MTTRYATAAEGAKIWEKNIMKMFEIEFNNDEQDARTVVESFLSDVVEFDEVESPAQIADGETDYWVAYNKGERVAGVRLI